MAAISRHSFAWFVFSLLAWPIVARSAEVDRSAAEWVVGIGGFVIVEPDGAKKQKVDKLDRLPAGEYRLIEAHLNFRDFQDDDLNRLAGVESLRRLALNGTKISDDTLRRVGQLTMLEGLSVSQTRISDAALAHLAPLQKLTWLNLQGVCITDAGMPHVARLAKLKDLTVSDSDITDAGIVALAPLKELQKVNFASAEITDAGVLALTQFRKLQSINLSRVLITDIGLVQLARRLPLKDIKITGTLVSETGAEAFRQALPRCKLTWDAPDNVAKQGSDGSLLGRRMLALDDDLAESLLTGVMLWQFDRVTRSGDKPHKPLTAVALADGTITGTVASLSPMTCDRRKTTLAVGYMKIEQPGDYAFKLAGPLDDSTFWLGTMSVRDFEKKPHAGVDVRLPACYLPIAAAGYIGGNGKISLQWRRPRAKSFESVPPDLLWHLPKEPPPDSYAAPPSALVSKLPLPLPSAVDPPATIRLVGDRVVTPVKIDEWCVGPLPSFLEGATVFASPFRHCETHVRFGVVEVVVERDTSLYLATEWDDFTSDQQPWKSQFLEKKDLARNGWVHVGHLDFRDPGPNRHHLYWRACKQGERLLLRTRFYRPPVIVAPVDPAVDPLDSVPSPEMFSVELADVLVSKCRYLFQSRNFDELERLATDFRARRPRMKDGRSYLARLYEGLLPIGKTDAQWHSDLGTFDRWFEAKPQSITAHIGMIAYWEKLAWRARSNSSDAHMSPEERHLFSERIQVAESFIDRARSLTEKDASLYDVEMRLAIDSGAPQVEIDRIIRQSLELDPADRGVFLEGARYYYPERHGRPGDIEAFALRAYEHTRQHWGAIVYGQIAWNTNVNRGHTFHEQFHFSWDLIKQGLTEFVDTYPDATAAAEFLARLAAYRGDRETARAAFARFDASTVRIWPSPERLTVWRRWAQDDFLDGDQQAVFQAGTSEVTQLGWTPDGRTLLTFDGQEVLGVWNVETQERTLSHRLPNAPRFVALTSAGTGVVCSDFYGNLHVQDYSTGRSQYFNGDGKRFGAMSLSPDDKLLVTVDGTKDIRIWDVATRAQVDSWTTKADLNSAVFADGGETVITGSKTKHVAWWDRSTHEHRASLPVFHDQIEELCLSQDGKRLVVQAGKELSVWQLPERTKLGDLGRATRRINEFAISPDGSRLVAAVGVTSPVMNGDLIVWDLNEMKQLKVLHGHKAMVRAVRFSPDGKLLASAGDDMTVRLWKVD